MPAEHLDGLKRCQAAIAELGIVGEIVHPGVPMPTVPLAAAAVGCHDEQIIKTVVFLDEDGRVVVGIANGTGRIDRGLLADVVGVAKGADERILSGLRENFTGECAEVGMYLAMSRAADREGYPEVAEAFKRYALEEADHAARFAELLGEVLTDSTKKNLQMRADAEYGACDGKKKLASLAKELGLDAIHDSVHEMCKDEARHGKGFDGLLKRYFG